MLGFFVSVCVIDRCGRLPVGGWLGYHGGCRKAKRDFNGLSRPFHGAKNNSLPQSPVLRESKNGSRFVTSGTPRSRKQLSISISGHSTNQKMDSVSLHRPSHEAENNSLSQSTDTLRIKLQLSFRYLGHSTKPKTTLCLNLQTLCETKNKSQFRSSGTMQSEKRISIVTSEYSGSEK